jgi:HAD superfamily hydrolase (TIGR01509 family)
MIDTVIFDLDGVVVNSEPVHQRLEDALFAELGLEIPDEVKKSFVGTSSIDMWTKIAGLYRPGKSAGELLLLGRGRYLAEVRKGNVPLVDGIRELLDRLIAHQFRILLASSSTSVTIGEVLKWFGLNEVFKVVVGGDQVSRSKPSPEIFLKAASLGNALPGNCVVIEDSMNGVIAAKEAGMFCIGFSSQDTGDQDLSRADLTVNRLDSITPGLIRNIQEELRS